MDPDAYWNQLCNKCLHTLRQHHKGSILEGGYGPCDACDCPAFVDRLKGERRVDLAAPTTGTSVQTDG